MELTGMRILIAGNDVSFAASVREALLAEGGNVAQTHCVVAADYNDLPVSEYDLVIISQLYDPGTHDAFLKSANTLDSEPYTPIFMLVDDVKDRAEVALMRGAADFMSIDEPVESIIDKIRGVHKQNDSIVMKSTIDITPKQPSVKGANIRVFVVEDDPLLRNLLTIKLEKSGFIYDFSENGEHLKSRLIAFKPQILILDLMLPGKNGFDILKELNACEQTKDIPVIVFSNRDSQSDRERAHTLGAVAFYVKAMTDLSELIELLEEHAS